MMRFSEGGSSATSVDPKRVFKIALDHNASSIILGHYHPSGNCAPSEANQQLIEEAFN
jgi:DNA repair protein RadC